MPCWALSWGWEAEDKTPRTKQTSCALTGQPWGLPPRVLPGRGVLAALGRSWSRRSGPPHPGMYSLSCGLTWRGERTSSAGSVGEGLQRGASLAKGNAWTGGEGQHGGWVEGTEGPCGQCREAQWPRPQLNVFMCPGYGSETECNERKW